MSDDIVRKGADDPIKTKVTTAKLEQHAELCTHGLVRISVDGELWHREPKSDERHVDVFVPCVATKAAR